LPTSVSVPVTNSPRAGKPVGSGMAFALRDVA